MSLELEPESGLLSGVRIVDATSVMAMPTAMYVMSDMGAEVIKVESHTRSRGGQGMYADGEPGHEPWNRDGSFHQLHRGKFGITLDLKVEEAVEMFKDLVRVSDVIAENNRPGVMDRLGLGYETLRKVNPNLVYFSFSGFGQTGPWRNYQGIGRMFELTGGVSQFTGYPEDGPRRVGQAWFDPPNGWMAVFAILSALHHRNKTGEGQRVDYSMYQLAASTVGDAILDYLANERNGRLMGNRHSSFSPHGVFRCKGDDQWIAISVTDDAQWDSLRQAMGDPAWARDDRYADVLSRLLHQESLNRHVGEWTKNYEHLELMSILQGAGVPAGAVLNSKEVLTNDHIKARGLYEEISYPAELGVGKRVHMGRPWKMSRTKSYIRRPAPSLGAHNDLVLGDLLGLQPQKIDQLYELGAIGAHPVPIPQPAKRPSLDSDIETGILVGHDPDHKKILGLE